MDMQTGKTFTEDQLRDIDFTINEAVGRLASIRELAMEIVGGNDSEALPVAIKDMSGFAGMSLDDLSRRITGFHGVYGTPENWMNMMQPWRQPKE